MGNTSAAHRPPPSAEPLVQGKASTVVRALLFVQMGRAGGQSIGDRVQANFFAGAGMPLTASAAAAANWTAVGDGACHPLYGRRYRVGKRLTPTMLYDHLGQVAGMQFAVDAGGGYPLYPASSVSSPPWFPSADEGGLWVATAHFSDPATLCAGAAPLPGGSVGDRVWTREAAAGTGASSFYALPPTLGQMRPKDGWVAGGCLPSNALPPALTSNGMGQHWWRWFRPRMPLQDGYPWFLLFDQRGRLTMFGLVVGGPATAYPTASGAMENGWREGATPIPGPYRMHYPKAATEELWTYPTQPLIPFFHQHGQMPEELLFLNEGNGSLPCGTRATSTLHVMLRAMDNITSEACAAVDYSDPVNAPGITAAAVRAAYGQQPPVLDRAAEGVWNLATQCRDEYAPAPGRRAEPLLPPAAYYALSALGGLLVGALMMRYLGQRQARPAGELDEPTLELIDGPKS
jgi:hypothetical protein